MSMTTSFFTLLATTGMLALVGCDRSAPPKQTVRASGSSALQPLVNAAKERFEADNKSISIEVSAGGSKKGLSDVSSGAVHIGNSDIFAPDDLKRQLVDHKVAVVGFAVMANKGAFNEKVPALTLAQIAKVFKGEVKDWKELGGAPQPIAVINRAAGSGTRTVFGNVVLGGDAFVEGQTEDNSGALVAKLKQTKGAISYLALSFEDDALVTIRVKTDEGAVDATPESIAAGRYPIWAYAHMYTRGEATGATKAFLEYVLSPDFQSKTLGTVKGFIPVTQMKVTKDKD
ncbi:MAG: Phosphate transporter, periplasmic phosphate-binding protein PstS [Labilithrix sp.]|nr:Phosphate transporter, periplasmic phosphate-binding protein PstS [Labilithrix sp.]